LKVQKKQKEKIVAEYTSADTAVIMRSIGELDGSVKAMHSGLTERINDIKEDIRRLEAAQSARMDSIERNLGHRIDGLSDRIVALENEDKNQIGQIAKLSAAGGGVGGALAAVGVELLKRMAG
jgi:hypothetical protein